MASVFNRKKDRCHRDLPYCISYIDENGRHRTIRGCTDKEATKEMARHMEDLDQLRRNWVRTADEDHMEE